MAAAEELHRFVLQVNRAEGHPRLVHVRISHANLTGRSSDSSEWRRTTVSSGHPAPMAGGATTSALRAWCLSTRLGPRA
jgi:hypothetical protein